MASADGCYFIPADRLGRISAKLGNRPLHLHTVLGEDMLQRGWIKWKRIARQLANFQARLFLTVFYGLIVLPFGLAARFFADPLRIKKPPTQWLAHPDEATDLQWARKQ